MAMAFLYPQVLIYILVTGLSVLAFISLKYLSRRKQEKKKYHPFAGTIFHQVLNFNRLHHYMTDLSAKYKTYRLFSPFGNEIYTADPANVEYILKTNFDNYGKGSYNYSHLSDLLGDGIFTVDGDRWREQRKVSSREFSTRNLRDFSSNIFRNYAIKLSNILTEVANNNRTIDIQDFFMKATMDSIFKVAFGVELDSISGSNEEGTKFTEAFENASALIARRYVDIFWKIKRTLSIGSEGELKIAIKEVDKFVYEVIRAKIEQMHKPQDDSELKKEDILSRFLQLNDTNPKYLRDIILNFIIAGKDTTAATLSWFIYMLCEHPATQEKVAQEIQQATCTKSITNVTEFVACLTDDALDKMHYLHAALTETLRLYPAVPLGVKTCFSDDTLPDGYNVKKGDMVAYLPYAMGRMKYIWGNDAEEFRPERWLDENGNFQSESPFKLTAFQAGPRICLGKEFAYRQMKIFSAVLLQFYVFKLHNEDEEVNYRTMLNLHIDRGLQICVMPKLVH